MWRLWPRAGIAEMLERAGFTGIQAFGKEVIPNFVFALAPPVRQYVFTSARKPLDRTRPSQTILTQKGSVEGRLRSARAGEV